MTRPQSQSADTDRFGEIMQEFFRTTPYVEWEHQTVAMNMDTMSVVRGASGAEIAEKYGPNFVVMFFGKADYALHPKRVR